MGNLTKIKATSDGLVRVSHGHKKGKKGLRKHGRNYRYYGDKHNQTLYRSRGQREKNKARRAAKRERRLQRLKDKRHGIYRKDNWPQDEDNRTSGSGAS